MNNYYPYNQMGYPNGYQQQYFNIPQTQNRLQELERGLNGQVPRPSFKAVPVTSFDEARAAMVDFDGSLNLFVDVQNNQIYTKQLNLNGLAELKVYKLVDEAPNRPTQVAYVTKEDYDILLEEVTSLKARLDSLGG